MADAEAGFGGPLNCFELMKMMIEAGAAGVHFEDQLSSEKKCGHLGGKVLHCSSMLCHCFRISKADCRKPSFLPSVKTKLDIFVF